MLDARNAVGDLGEVAEAELLLLLEAERAVVGRDDAEVVGAKPPPQVGVVRARAQRRRADELRALETLAREVGLGEKQVLRAGLGEDVLSAVARRHHLVERFGGREVHDVERGAGDARELDRAMRRLTFEERRARRRRGSEGRPRRAPATGRRARRWRCHFLRAS